MPNNQIHLTVKSVTNFAIAKFPPLFTSSDLGVKWKLRQKWANNMSSRSNELIRIMHNSGFTILEDAKPAINLLVSKLTMQSVEGLAAVVHSNYSALGVLAVSQDYVLFAKPATKGFLGIGSEEQIFVAWERSDCNLSRKVGTSIQDVINGNHHAAQTLGQIYHITDQKFSEFLLKADRLKEEYRKNDILVQQWRDLEIYFTKEIKPNSPRPSL